MYIKKDVIAYMVNLICFFDLIFLVERDKNLNT